MARRIGLGLALALAGLVLLFALALALAQTGPGKRLVAAGLEQALAGPDTRAEVAGLRGTVPFDMALDHLALAGPAGPWLRIADARLNWSPSALLRGRLEVEELSARRIEVLRPPPAGEEEPPTDEPLRLPELPESLFPTTIDRILVDELVVGEPVLGRAATFRVAGSVATAPGGEAATVEVDVERTDEDTAEASVEATLQLQPARLDLDVAATETGGLLAAVTGRPEAADFRLRLTGSGPLTDWTARVEASAENLLQAEGEIGLAAVEQPVLTVDLAVDPAAALLPADFAPLVGDRITLVARLVQPAAQRVRVEQLRIETALAQLDGAGRFDLENEQVALEAAFELADLEPLSGLAQMPLDGSMRVALSADGDLLQPEGRIEVTFADIAAAEMRAARIETTADWNIVAPLTRRLAVAVSGQGSATAVDLATDPPLPVEDWTWQFEAGAPAGEPLQLEQLTLAGGPLRLAASGAFDPETQAAALDLSLNVTELASLSEAFGQRVGGALELAAELRVPEGGEQLQAELSGALEQLQGLPPAATALLGPRVTIAAAGTFDPASRLRVRDLRIDAQQLQLTGDLGLDLPEQSLSGALFLTLPELAALEPALEQSIGGRLTLAAALEGTLDSPDLILEARSQEILIANQVLQDLALRLTADDLTETPAGNLRLALTAAGLPTSLEADYALADQQLRVADLILQAPGARLGGEFVADLATSLVEGRIEGRVQEISRLDPLLPVRARGELGLDLRLAPEDGGQTVRLGLVGDDLRTDFGALRSLDLEASVTDAFGEPRIAANLGIAGFRQEALQLSEAEVEANGTLDALTVEAALEGEATAPFSLRTSGEVAIGEPLAVRIAALAGEVAGEPLRLLAPTEIRLAGETLQVEPLRLSYAEAQLAAELRMGTEEITAELDLSDLPLRVLARFGGPDLAGRASATLSLDGTLAEPRGQLELNVVDLASPDDALADLPPIQLSGTAELGPERLSAELTASGATETPVTLTASLPVNVGLQPFAFELPPGGELEGRLVAQLNLARIDDLLALDDQLIQGQLALDLALAGTAVEPLVNGTIAIDDGRYENGTTGTVLRDITVRADATRQQIVVRELSATDGGNGRLRGEGLVRIEPEGDYPYELELRMNDARLVRREDVEATLGGRVQLAGDIEGALLSGTINVHRAEISIAETPGPSIAVLDVEEVGGPAGPEIGGTNGAAADAAEEDFRLRLELVVDIPAQVFVRGRGLDSEWQGRLQVTGTAEDPVLVGDLEIRRGHFDFIDRRFELRSGQIEFTGDTPPVPFISLEAAATAEDLTAIVRLEGPVTEPTITLDSEPALPQDEVLSRLLFNRPVSEIGPTEAVRLAAALNRLRGGGGLDLFGRARDLLGVDVLDVTTGEGGDGVVRAGRYLGDDVYLEVERGTAGQTGRARVEIEVLPNVSLEAEAGEDAASGVGLKWKYDY